MERKQGPRWKSNFDGDVYKRRPESVYSTPAERLQRRRTALFVVWSDVQRWPPTDDEQAGRATFSGPVLLRPIRFVFQSGYEQVIRCRI